MLCAGVTFFRPSGRFRAQVSLAGQLCGVQLIELQISKQDATVVSHWPRKP